MIIQQATRVNTVKPQQNEAGIKTRLYIAVWKRFNFGTGVKAKYKLLQDRNIQDFNYTEEIFRSLRGPLGTNRQNMI